MLFFKDRTLKVQIVIWTGFLVMLVFCAFIILASINFHKKFRDSIYHDIATQNEGYIFTIHSIFEAKKDTILSLRDDLELYDTRGQMWVHLAAHAGEKVFDDPQK